MSEPTDVAIVAENPLVVLTDQEKFDAFYQRVRATVIDVPVDLTTAAGRKAVASLAFKVVKSKTAILAAAEALTADAREQIKKVNASKGEIATKLDELRDEVRKPLTDWEAAEEARAARVKAARDLLTAEAVVRAEETAEEIEGRLLILSAQAYPAGEFGDEAATLQALRDIAVRALSQGLERAKKAEADAAELDRLRAAEAERVRLAEVAEAERLEREAAEQAEASRIEAERLEAERIEQERQETERVEREAEEQRVIREQEIAAEAAEEAAQAERDRLAAEQAERDREAEDQRIAAEEAHAAEVKQLQDKVDAANRERDERAQRDAADAIVAAEVAREAEARRQDREHKGKIMGAAKDAMISLGCDEEVAKKIVLAIVADEIPSVSLAF